MIPPVDQPKGELDQPLTDRERIVAMSAGYPDAPCDMTWAEVEAALTAIPAAGVGEPMACAVLDRHGIAVKLLWREALDDPTHADEDVLHPDGAPHRTVPLTTNSDRYGLALMMIAHGCADPQDFARKILGSAAASPAVTERDQPRIIASAIAADVMGNDHLRHLLDEQQADEVHGHIQTAVVRALKDTKP